MSDQQFLRTILVLPVRDIEESTEWYRNTLGFEALYLHEDTRGQGPANYAVLQRGGAELHLILDEPPPHEQPWTKAGTGYLYLKVRDVEEVFREVAAQSAAIGRGLQTENWGARGFNLADPSGNAIHIEQEG